MEVIFGDSLAVLKALPKASVDMIFTSPTPFGLASKGIGSEQNDFEYITNLTNIFTEAYRVVKPQGNFWINLQDRHDKEGRHLNTAETFVIYMKVHNMWMLRQRCFWFRTEKGYGQDDYNRFQRNVEYLYFFTKDKNHYFNNPQKKVLSSVFEAAYRKPGKQEFESGFPEKIIERCISLTCPPKGVVMDTFADSGTTAVVAKKMGRDYIMIDNDFDKYLAMKGRLGLK